MWRNCIAASRGRFPSLGFWLSMSTSRVHCNSLYSKCHGINFLQGRSQFLPSSSSSRELRCIAARSFSCSARHDIDFSPKEVVVTTNYNYWHEHPEGVQMNVTYIDTASDLPFWDARDMPTVLAMHGSPGTHKDLLPIAEPLAEMGARVILPNFPGYDQTYGLTQEDDDFFTHTTEERSNFIMQVLGALDVSRVDVLLCHSAASWPLYYLASLLPSLKGIVMITPGPGHTPPRSSRPEWVMKFLTQCWDRHYLRPLVNLTVRVLVKPISGIGYGKVSHIISALRTAAGFQFESMPDLMQQINYRNLPMLQFTCKNDVLMDYDLCMKSADMLGFPKEAVDHYDKDGTLISQGKLPKDRYVKRVIFDLKTHYPQKKTAFLPIINREISGLYKHIFGVPKGMENQQEFADNRREDLARSKARNV